MSVTLEDLERQHRNAVNEAKVARSERSTLAIAYSRGMIDAAEHKTRLAVVNAKIERWDDEISRLEEAIAALKEVEETPPPPDEADTRIVDLLAQVRDIDGKVKAGFITYDAYMRSWSTLTAQLKALGYAVETLTIVPKPEVPEPPPSPPPEEVDDLATRAREASKDAVSACIRRGTSAWACVNVGKIAYDAIMQGRTESEALALAKAAEKSTLGEGALENLVTMVTSMGKLGDMTSDSGIASMLAGPVQMFMASLGVTPEALKEVMASPMDRDKAAQMATGISIAAQTGLGLLYSIGVLTEIGSMGQIDTIVAVIDNMMRSLGIDEIIKPLFTAPSYAALTVPVRQYWMSVFKPTIPPIEDLRLMAVREAFDVPTRAEQFAEMGKWGGYHGLDEFWAERYLKAGYERMDVRTALDMFYWRLWDEDQLKAFLSIADIHPDDHDSIISTLWRSPTRYERRHGYIMGVYDDKALVEYFHRDGLSDDDSKTATLAMTAYALNAERNAVARAAGRIYRETIEAVEEKLGDLGTAARDAIDDVVAMEKLLEAGEGDVTPMDVETASLKVADIQAELGGLRKSAEAILMKAEAEFRTELTELKVTAERQDLWVRRYAMEAKVKTRPWELIEEVVPELPFEPE